MLKFALFYPPNGSDEMDTAFRRPSYAHEGQMVEMLAHVEVVGGKHNSIRDFLNSMLGMERKPMAFIPFDDSVSDDVIHAVARNNAGLPIIFMAHEVKNRVDHKGREYGAAIVTPYLGAERFDAIPTDNILEGHSWLRDFNRPPQHPAESDRTAGPPPRGGLKARSFTTIHGPQIRGKGITTPASPNSWQTRRLTMDVLEKTYFKEGIRPWEKKAPAEPAVAIKPAAEVAAALQRPPARRITRAARGGAETGELPFGAPVIA